ncbi:MAG: hypothetical protein JKY96_03000 [Phycisphaerales bacterium]|nr:hypothetical protein [Phycisphaerales bacterium]
MNKDFILSVFIAATLAVSPLSASESSQTQAPVDKVEAKELPPYEMNRGAVFAEDELLAAALGESFSAMITAVQNGEITDRHISTEDQQRHSFFMGALRRLATDPDPSSALPLVLKSFSPDGGKSFLISVAFMSPHEQGNQIEKIIEFHAYPYVDGYRFRSPFEYRTRTLDMLEVDEVRYHFQSSFDRAQAEEFARFKKDFEARVGMPTTDLEYFCFETLDEVLRAYGIVYDCTRCNWLKEDLGFMDNDGRVFVTGTGNERFIFDYLVDYMSRYCDDDGDLYPPFVYGMAAYYGGYGLGGDDIETLKSQFRDELAARPDMNFLEEFHKGRKSSIRRHFTYFVISAFLCEEVLDRHGFDEVMKLARSGRSGEQFFETLESMLGVGEDDFHEFITQLIREDD